MDSKHVNPDSAGMPRRVLSVKIPGSATDITSLDAPVEAGRYGDHPQDDPNVNIPAGIRQSRSPTETTSLYDPEDPTLAYRYDPSQPLSRRSRFTAPLPSGLSLYGSHCLRRRDRPRRLNYYDPNNTTTTFQRGETQVVIEAGIAAGVDRRQDSLWNRCR